MKKILLDLILGVVLSVPSFAAAVNNIYCANLSTITITQTNSVPDIAYAACNIRGVYFTNITGSSETVSVYSNALSTNTTLATLITTYEIPAAIGTYEVPLFTPKPTVWSSAADYVTVAYPAFRSSAAYGSTSKVTVKYWK